MSRKRKANTSIETGTEYSRPSKSQELYTKKVFFTRRFNIFRSKTCTQKYTKYKLNSQRTNSVTAQALVGT